MKSLRNTLILSILLPILVVFILLGFVFMQFMEKKEHKRGRCGYGILSSADGKRCGYYFI